VLFIDGLATFDGVPDLIIDAEQGRAVALALDDDSSLLLRNHGVLVAERSVAWATLTAVLLEKSVQLQSIASSLGQLQPISPEWVQRIHVRKYQAGFAEEYWDAWVRELRRNGGAFGMPEEGP
jgi:ribulose-5-phosphate 4-epimerase/fuculose-1-phosphate aldolase